MASDLAAAAEKSRVALNFEAAVGGAIPIVKTLREGLAGNSLARIYGILNGTCNYMLTRMEQEKLSYADCLAEAQRLGYAEADPTFDVEGHDTAQKLAILASLAFGTKVDQSAVYVEGISSIAPEDLEWADELGYRVKLLGVAVRTEKGIEQRVHPTMVPKVSPIAQVMGVINAMTIDADAIAPITLVGPGAGGMATASAVVSDIADIARGIRLAPFGRPVARLKRSAKAPMQRHEGGYYIRLLARGPARYRGDHRQAARPAEYLTRIDRPAAWRSAWRGSRPRQARQRPGSGDPDHLCDHRGCRAQGAGCGLPRQGHLRQAASHPHREELNQFQRTTLISAAAHHQPGDTARAVSPL